MSVAALIGPLSAIDTDAQAQPVWLHTADTLACLTAGLATGEGAALAAFYGDVETAGRAAVIRYTEADAIHVPTCVTPAAIAVPVALAEAGDGASYVRGVAAGYAVGLALAEAVGGAAALAHGVWPTLFAAPAIAAASAALARGWDANDAAHAVALALAGISGRAGRPGGVPSGRWLAIGEATRKGLSAVKAIEAGARGDTALVSADWLAAQTGPGLAEPAALRADPAAIARTGLKPFVAARQACAAITAVLEIRAAGVDPNAIVSLEVFLPPVTLAVVTRPVEPGNRLSVVANLPLQLGLAAHAPAMLCDVAREGQLPAAALAFAGKVTVSPDASLAGAGHWPARLVIETTDGTVEHRVDAIAGDPDDPDLGAMVRTKAAALGASGIAWLLDEIANGAATDDLLAIARELARSAAAPAEQSRRRVG